MKNIFPKLMIVIALFMTLAACSDEPRDEGISETADAIVDQTIDIQDPELPTRIVPVTPSEEEELPVFPTEPRTAVEDVPPPHVAPPPVEGGEWQLVEPVRRDRDDSSDYIYGERRLGAELRD